VATVNRHVTSTDGTIVPSLLDYLRVVGRRKLVFLLIVLLVPATAVAVSLRQTPTYRASAEVLLETRDIGATYVDPQRAAQTRAELARVPAVVDRVLDAVPSAGLDRKEFLESSTVSATLGSDILTFSVENSDPRLAMRLATEYATAFTEYQQRLDNQAIERMLDQVRQQLAQLEANGEGAGSSNYDALQRREETLAGASAAQSRSAQVVNPAGEAPKVGPRTVRNGLIAFCLGLVLALVVVFLVDAFDTRVRSVDTIRETLGLRLLGRLAVPPSRLRKEDGLVMLADPTSRDAEQFRALRASLDLANAEHGARTIMITSAVDGEGKSTTVANLALALARAGRRVVLIDADLSHPYLHRLFYLDQWPGLTDVELGETWLVDALQPIGLTEDFSGTDDSSKRMEHTGSLEVLPGGSALQDPDELVFDRAVGRIIQRVRGRADIVLVDGPPLLRGHAMALSAHVEAVVVVVRLKALTTSTLEDLSWVLEASPAPTLGFILTGVDKSEGYDPHRRYGHSERRQAVRHRPTLTVSPAAIDGDGDVLGRHGDETQAGVRPNVTTGESETDGRGDEPASGAPAQARSNSGRPFGGLSPREAALRSAQNRRAKSAQRAQAAQRGAPEETQDAVEDA
jgi:non-specific protein-tyrosine kinase